MKSFVLVLILLATTVLGGCATQTFLIGQGTAGPTASLEQSQAFFVGGIGQEQFVNAAEVCGGSENILQIETEMSALDGVLNWLTGGIYSPRTARVFCK